jgi:hypothetical protein
MTLAPRDSKILKNETETYPNLFDTLIVNSIQFPGGILSNVVRTSTSATFTGQRTFTAPIYFAKVGNITNLLFTIPPASTVAGSSIVGTIASGGFPPDIGITVSGYATLLEGTTPIPASITYSGTTITIQKLGNGVLTSFGSAVLSGTCCITYSVGNF